MFFWLYLLFLFYSILYITLSLYNNNETFKTSYQILLEHKKSSKSSTFYWNISKVNGNETQLSTRYYVAAYWSVWWNANIKILENCANWSLVWILWVKKCVFEGRRFYDFSLNFSFIWGDVWSLDCLFFKENWCIQLINWEIIKKNKNSIIRRRQRVFHQRHPRIPFRPKNNQQFLSNIHRSQRIQSQSPTRFYTWTFQIKKSLLQILTRKLNIKIWIFYQLEPRQKCKFNMVTKYIGFILSWYLESKKWEISTIYYLCYELVYGCLAGFCAQVYWKWVEGEGIG